MPPPSITQLAQEAVDCPNQMISAGSIDPAIQSLKNIKSVFKDSDYTSPKDFLEAKALRPLSGQTIDYVDYLGMPSFVLDFRRREDKEQLAGIIKVKFNDHDSVMEVIDQQQFYFEPTKYILGILLD